MSIEKMIEAEAEKFANETCLFKKNETDAYYDVSINARRDAYIAGRSAQIESEKKKDERIKWLEERLMLDAKIFKDNGNHYQADTIKKLLAKNN